MFSTKKLPRNFTNCMHYILVRSFPLVLLLIFPVLLRAQTTDEKGRKQGYWKKKDEKTDKLIYEGEFSDDKPVGKFRYYYPNDSLKAVVTFRKNSQSSYARLFHGNGKRMAEGKYSNKEMRDSVWTFYDESGQLLSRETYKGGKRDGKSYVYFPDGTLSEEKSWAGGVEEGQFRQYFEAKKLRTEGSYKAGKLNGRTVYYYPNGVEAAAGFYKDGQKNGPWIYRNTAGKVTEKELYKNGTLATPAETEKFFQTNKVSDTKPGKKK